MNLQGHSSVATKAAATTGAAASRSAALAFGSRRGLFALLIKNMLLSALTLMIYRFWARTALRRFLWSRVRIDGDPLEYTGRGGELFVGFLIAMVVLVPILGGFALIEQFLEPASTTFFVEKIVYALAIYVLVAIAQFRARAYRLSRTLWRGIRFAQTGSQWAYVRLSLGWALVVLVTLGLAYPWMRWAQARYLIRNTWFGDRAFEFAPYARPPFMPWLVVQTLVAIPVGLGLVFVFGESVLEQLGVSFDIEPLLVLISSADMALGLLVPALALAFVHFRVRELRALVGTTLLGLTLFRSDARTSSIVGQCLLYVLAVLVAVAAGVVAIGFLVFGGTFDPSAFDSGLGARRPGLGVTVMAVAAVVVIYAMLGTLWTWITVFGVLRHVCTTLIVEHVEALSAIGQSTIAGPRSGEGLADSFDVGV